MLTIVFKLPVLALPVIIPTNYLVCFLSQPDLGGVIYVGSATPIGSALEKYFAHSSCHFRLLAQASLAPINFL